MARIGDRVAALEARHRAHRPQLRCATCRDWPSLPVVFGDDGSGVARPHPMDGHTCCPSCGWAPEHILRVVYESLEPVERS